MAQYENPQSQTSNARGMTGETKDRAQSAYEKARDFSEHAADRTSEVARVATDTVKQHPIGTLAAVAGLAFVVGALWKLQSDRRRSHGEALMSQLSDFVQRQQRSWPNLWR
jgi:ElaB/YqjD/DUF883 family membrane-anchored ribosome-binding protein